MKQQATKPSLSSNAAASRELVGKVRSEVVAEDPALETEMDVSKTALMVRKDGPRASFAGASMAHPSRRRRRARAARPNPWRLRAEARMAAERQARDAKLPPLPAIGQTASDPSEGLTLPLARAHAASLRAVERELDARLSDLARRENPTSAAKVEDAAQAQRITLASAGVRCRRRRDLVDGALPTGSMNPGSFAAVARGASQKLLLLGLTFVTAYLMTAFV